MADWSQNLTSIPKTHIKNTLTKSIQAGKKCGKLVFQRPVTISKSRLRGHPSQEPLAFSKIPIRTQGDIHILNLPNLDRQPKFGPLVYQKALTISRWKIKMPTQVRKNSMSYKNQNRRMKDIYVFSQNEGRTKFEALVITIFNKIQIKNKKPNISQMPLVSSKVPIRL